MAVLFLALARMGCLRIVSILPRRLRRRLTFLLFSFCKTAFDLKLNCSVMNERRTVQAGRKKPP